MLYGRPGALEGSLTCFIWESLKGEEGHLFEGVVVEGGRGGACFVGEKEGGHCF